MASSVSYLVVGFLVLAAEAAIGNGVEMQEEELLGLFEVMGSLLEDQSWAQGHPQPCTETPWPGLQCEVGQEDPPMFHVTKIHVGPDVLSPPCKPSANLSASLLKLPYLRTLSVFSCFVASSSPLTLSPALFGSLSSLEHLNLQSNPSLSGTIPPSLAQIRNLRVLSLSQNSLQGPIPGELGGLVNLEQLDLSYNNLSGTVPEQIGGLKGLSILDLSSNNLEGQVPSTLGQLELLQKVDLCNNKLTGKLPESVGQLKKLVLLDLSNNMLQGPIPETLSGLEQVQYFLVDRNPINTGVPLFLGALNKLTTVSLSGCGLKGPIPNSLSRLKNLTALSLDSNSLTGTIPPSIGKLPNLGQLNLSWNRLEGELKLPQEFMDRLGKRLDIRGNIGLCTSNRVYKKNVPSCSTTITQAPNDSKPSTLTRHHSPSSSVSLFLGSFTLLLVQVWVVLAATYVLGTGR